VTTVKVHKSRIRATIVKADSERRLLTAVTNVVTDEDGNKIVDHDGDIMDINNLEDEFIKAFGEGGTDKSGVMHESDGGADVAMYFTLSADEWKALKDGGYIGQEIGIVKIRVNDDDVWAAVKEGRLPEVSIEGDGERTPIE